jgi:hypothetical protein
MNINKSWAHDQPTSINDMISFHPFDAPHFYDAAILDTNIASEPGIRCSRN